GAARRPARRAIPIRPATWPARDREARRARRARRARPATLAVPRPPRPAAGRFPRPPVETRGRPQLPLARAAAAAAPADQGGPRRLGPSTTPTSNDEG